MSSNKIVAQFHKMKDEKSWNSLLEAAELKSAGIEEIRNVANIYFNGFKGVDIAIERDLQKVEKFLRRSAAKGCSESIFDCAMLFEKDTKKKAIIFQKTKKNNKNSASLRGRSANALGNIYCNLKNYQKALEEYKYAKAFNFDSSMSIYKVALAIVHARNIETSRIIQDVLE